MAAATTLYKGGMVALDAAGNAIAPTLAINQIIVGICLEDVVNAGAAAAANVEVGTGVFRLDNFGAITKASIGDIVYCHDDVSVQASGTGASPAGKMVDIDSTGVWVELYCPDPAAAVAGALLAANNLNDVNTNLTALNNLLGGTAKLIAAADALDTTDASVFTLGATTATGMSLARTGQLTEIKGGLKVDQAVELVGIVQHADAGHRRRLHHPRPHGRRCDHLARHRGGEQGHEGHAPEHRGQRRGARRVCGQRGGHHHGQHRRGEHRQGCGRGNARQHQGDGHQGQLRHHPERRRWRLVDRRRRGRVGIAESTKIPDAALPQETSK
jgi:hypothetical protein